MKKKILVSLAVLVGSVALSFSAIPQNVFSYSNSFSVNAEEMEFFYGQTRMNII